ncbi:glycoside hydrolase family 53 protein [Massilia luteola]|uniref:glycoside hydrolase family 53 protein n=1 Tax=Massilia luteola TaxID=3081751 RepID=UPI002ACC2FF7|nr:glycosyl hydrolase 53 family protein [Massilia sp. Gc5]
MKHFLFALAAGLALGSALAHADVADAHRTFAKGADVGWVSEMEASGRVFRNRDGKAEDLYAILKEQGMDAIRLRVWVHPQDGWNGIADVVAKAKRAQAAGMRIMIDFHYSDSWADPQQQTKPKAWADYTVPQLAAAVDAHTRATLTALRDAGVAPTWVQVGNETRTGMLWPEGDATRHMDNYARFVDSGYGAVKQVFPDAIVIVHVDNCHDNATFRWNFDGLKAHGARFDMIGASSYPTTAKNLTWRDATTACLANLNDMVHRYGKPVILSEVGVPWDQPDGKAVIADLIAKARAVDGGGAGGVFYWEPEAYDWKGYPMGAFDRGGKPTAIMDAFLER